MDDLTTKRCTRCTLDLPLSAFNKYRYAPDGLQRYCRACQKEKANTYIRKQRSQRTGRNKHLAALGAEEYAKHASQIKQRNYQEHREESLMRDRARYQRNREHLRDLGRAHYQRNKPSYRAWARKWARNNPLRTAEYIRRYQARKKGATVELVSYEAIWQRDRGICHICGLFVDPMKRHFDHIIPLSKGGLHCMSNIAVAHSWCNQEKGDRPLERYTNRR